jgi:nitroreductase
MQEYLNTIKQCQRNFDLNKPVSNDHIQQLIDVAHNAPKKNSMRFFSLVVLQSRDKVHEFAKVTLPEVLAKSGAPDAVVQAQAYAPLVMCWVHDDYLHKEYFAQEPHKAAGHDPDMKYLHVGISSTCVAMKAAELGYKTGFCACYGSSRELLKKYGIDGEIVLFLGIGHPQENINYYEKKTPSWPDETKFEEGDYVSQDFIDSETRNKNNFLCLDPITKIL